MKVWKYIPALSALAVIYALFFLNGENNKTVMDYLQGLESPLTGISEAVDQHKNDFIWRNEWIDMFGLAQKVMDKRIVGDFDFAKDDTGLLQQKLSIYVSEQQATDFTEDMKELDSVVRQSGGVLLYVALPDRTQNFPVAYSGEMEFFGNASKKMASTLTEAGIDCLNVEDLLVSSETPPLDEFYFRTDGHCSTWGEFWTAKETARYLQEQYGIIFPNSAQVFDLVNYRTEIHPFLGNLARSSGHAYAGMDNFEIYIPNFETSFSYYNLNPREQRTGLFQDVMLAGWEGDEYVYWILDYGHFMSPCYKYQNHLAPTDAPNVMVICDSIFMRGFSYLALGCNKLTVLDFRCGGASNLINELSTKDYDAVIVIGQDPSMYGVRFDSWVDVPDLPQKEMISSEERGSWIADAGICPGLWFDGTYYGFQQWNDVSADGLPIQLSAPYVCIDGWAADFWHNAPFQALYLQVGDVTLRCDYGLESQPVVDAFGIETLDHCTFRVNFPTELLRNGAVSEISFIGVSADGKHTYQPVTYEIAYFD